MIGGLYRLGLGVAQYHPNHGHSNDVQSSWEEEYFLRYQLSLHPPHGARKWGCISKMIICLDISGIAISALYKWLAGYILQCHLCKSKTIHAQATTNHRSPLSYSCDIETWHLRAQKIFSHCTFRLLMCNKIFVDNISYIYVKIFGSIISKEL